ncbi:MAG: GAF domain-containing protein, partial [Bacteroidota bacterium]
IQQECTTIHPAVKWRFEEEAERFMEDQLSGGQPVFKDIVFSNLYPLYGQLDIKGSSERRNKAVSADLLKQIRGVSKVLKAAFKKKPLSAYEELLFRLDSFAAELKNELAAGSEHRILSFLSDDVYPVFDYLKSDADLQKSIENYYSMLDEEVKSVYQERKKYDTSVNLINQRLASYIDERQVEAQEMFPHYFERYKTDGVEFNMYLGQSIAKEQQFDKIYLRNLRIWQLVTMCEMENEFHSMKQELGTQIEIASLILVYNTPISVHFRMDEKQFDVEGAYNARYEIIKKRVDKAHIKGTKERITKPENIVIVYSQEKDAQEYRTYLQFLAAKGYLKEEIEDFALEDLQGVHGLRALRVEVDYSGSLTVNELIKEMEVNG